MIGLKSNRIGDIYHWFKSLIVEIADENERRAVADEVLFRFFDIRKEQRVAYPERRLVESDIVRLKKAANRLNRGEPVQYITGITDFLGCIISVKPSVLIPRPETEDLVLWVINDAKTTWQNQDNLLKIIDIGTGSGCIAIALAAGMQGSHIIATDNDQQILQVAKHNAQKNNVKIQFMIQDILSSDDNNIENAIEENSLDIVVSNPPYVRESEKATMAKNVLDFEPSSALYVPENDPLVYYKAIAGKAKKWLKQGGRLYLEINENLSAECRNMILDEGFSEALIKKDIHGKARFIRALIG